MPFGDHWEWRGFGQALSEFQHWFRDLPPLYSPRQQLPTEDIYLWTPASVHNVKLRGDALKFKRFLAREGPYERWLEDERDWLPFPLSPHHLRTLARLLGIHLPQAPDRAIDRDVLLQLLARAHPPVHQVTVLKRRRLARWPHSTSEEVIVEWTHILRPVAVETVALEHPSLPVLRNAHIRLEPLLGAGLEAMNYLQAIGRWLEQEESA